MNPEWRADMALLQNSNNNLTKERDQLLETNSNLTEQRDQLQKRLRDVTQEKSDLFKEFQGKYLSLYTGQHTSLSCVYVKFLLKLNI